MFGFDFRQARHLVTPNCLAMRSVLSASRPIKIGAGIRAYHLTGRYHPHRGWRGSTGSDAGSFHTARDAVHDDAKAPGAHVAYPLYLMGVVDACPTCSGGTPEPKPGTQSEPIGNAPSSILRRTLPLLLA